ncbi:diguanylate cyclase (GGDEF)-like protein/PAS domain S-box-containing protein [Actinoplanes lutulentus]|uniref:PAS domain S-box-containing protein/diguanylate cyclase (GGDEF)-like protein n=1 Tax=Actinoplanes lutulentus TaxID=1287878 RepID=A0A327Z1H8_9ACTN|nr:sensor domain-containing diguanylate cyclase [Actinoplanes lutulentus]MBB2943655.1 diguanylate cyclase (GGDEF)-like protein/PAS domain S-box-containing protein [Actinoplanes lutulentus]RAK27519.1 PAS domain S-box-containing protein/diguanylate cyclase (GGDEF)-like protein [Actinoplanes lutulentus]
MTDKQLMKPGDRDAVLAALVAKYPDAFIAAIGSNGMFAPMPREVTETGLRPIEGASSMLGLIVDDDQRLVIDAWSRVVAEGVASCLVHLKAAPDCRVRMHFVDATHRYGVHIAIINGSGLSADLTLLPEVVRPRLVTMIKNQVSVVTEVGAEIGPLLGWTPAELVGQRTLELVHPGDQQRAIASWMDMLGTPHGSARRVRLRHLHRDGHTVWFEVTNHNYLADPGDPRVVAEMLDISDEMAAQEAVRAAEQLMRRLTETIPLSILQVTHEGRITFLNERAARQVKAQVGDVLSQAVLEATEPVDRPVVERALAGVLTGQDTDLEYGHREPGAGNRRIRANLRALADDSGTVTGAIVCLADVTEEASLRETLWRQATFDALTGCHNRAATVAALQDALTTPDRHAGTAVIFLDLNSFKPINDRYGHAAGDLLLSQVATSLRGSVPSGAVVGRIGGDEFVAVCRDIGGRESAERIGADLLAALSAARVQVDGGTLVPQASLGVAWSAYGGGNPDELLAQADAAMYAMKRSRSGSRALDLTPVAG